MMMLMDCNNATLGIILYYFKNILNIIWIVGPLLAIISLTINFIMLVKDPEDKKAPHKIRNSLIALVVLFMIPALVNAFMLIANDSFEISACWKQDVSKPDLNPTYVNPYGDQSTTPIYSDPTGYDPSTEKSSTDTKPSTDTNTLFKACEDQAEWMKNYTYAWEGNPTIEKSKTKGTCVTYVACVLQRINVLNSGEFIWINNNGKVVHTNSMMDVTYLSGTLKSNKEQFQAGDIIIGGNGNINAGEGSHIFILTGEWNGDNPYIYDNGSAERVKNGRKAVHTIRGTYKVIARIRLKK